MAETWPPFWAAVREARTFAEIQGLLRQRRTLLRHGPPPPLPAQARVALLGSATTNMIEQPLGLLLEAIGLEAKLHQAPFNSYVAEMFDAGSATSGFKPDVAAVIATSSAIPGWPHWNDPAERVAAAVHEACEHLLRPCRALHQRTGCDVVLTTMTPLPERPLGSAGIRYPGEANRFLAAVNEALARAAEPWLHLLDVAALAALHGVYQWHDARMWYHGRFPVSFECFVPYVRALAQLIGALYGRSAKCVVVDLDDTLWGGIVGDDGVDGLVLGEGDARGEAFVALQRYLARLRERGVLLAVCSKNDEATALAPFAQRREMVLRREDFAAFVANWRPKSENLRAIARQLNIGLDALVLVDDNPAERAEVRRALPDVRVIELGDDPADYPAALDRAGWLETALISADDRERARGVAANAAREDLRAAAEDYSGYLRSLEQRAVIAPFRAADLDRIVQLTNKTNQFNLTTLRVTRADMEARLAGGGLTATVRLADRFGDNGLISVLAARAEGADWWIDLWLMSCRVFNRGVEHLLCNHLVSEALRANVRCIHGLFRPSARNALVREHYQAMGFQASAPADGAEHWVLDPAGFRPFETTIRLEAGDQGAA